jgi:hypothetical protein
VAGCSSAANSSTPGRPGTCPLRQLAAVQLVANKAARVGDVATAFGVDTGTLWRWGQQLSGTGVGGLVPDKRGPKGAHRLTPEVVAEITARRANGARYRAIATAIGVSCTSDHDDDHDTGRDSDATTTTEDTDAAGDELPVLPPPADRDAERAAARWGKLPHAEPVFTPAARVPLAGLLLAIPALEATGLLSCATTVFGQLRNGFYGLDTMLVEGVLRALAGQPRAEGATRIDPAALGRVLGLDRDRRSRRSAATSPPWPLPGGPTSCSPRWHKATSPAWTRATRACWRCSTSTGTSAPTKAGARSPKPTYPG